MDAFTWFGHKILPNQVILRNDMEYPCHRRPYWWEGVVNLFWHVTAFNQSDYSIDQSNCRTALTCQNKFTTPPHQCRRLLPSIIVLHADYAVIARIGSRVKEFDVLLYQQCQVRDWKRIQKFLTDHVLCYALAIFEALANFQNFLSCYIVKFPLRGPFTVLVNGISLLTLE